MDYQKVIKFRNQHHAFGKLIGMETTVIKRGYAIVHLDVREELKNPNNSVHGGVIYSLADTSAGSAATSYGEKVATVDSSFHFLRPAIDTSILIAEATEIKHGKRIMLFRVDVTDEDEKLIATGNFTYTSLGMKIDFDKIEE